MDLLWVLAAGGFLGTSLLLYLLWRSHREGARLRERLEAASMNLQHLQTSFSRFAPEALVERIIAGGLPQGGEKKEVTVLFADLVGFTPLAESIEPAMLVGILFSWLGVLFVMPTIRPVRPSWLLFTYVIPLIPLLVLWDGLVSCLRVYSPAELEELLDGVTGSEDFTWEIGRIRLGRAPIHATYLLGTPKG